MPNPSRLVATIALGSVVILGVACSSAPPTLSSEAALDSATSVTVPKLDIPPMATTLERQSTSTTTPGKGKAEVPGSTVPKKATTTTAAKKSGPEFAGQAIEAFRQELGDFRALDLTVWFGANERAQLQAQDPTKPENVDAYEFTGTKVGSPVPVVLHGDGSLEENLFSSSEVAWDKIPALFEEAKTAIGSLEGSTGVTHLIVQRNLPLDTNTVINVYVDGGTRSQGGYVSFNAADGVLLKTHGPS